MSKSSEYWARRYKLIEQACHDISLEYLEEMEKKYRDAEQTIQAKINAWYGRFAVNNNISMLEARKWLNDKELDELKWNVEQYIKYGKQNAIDGKWAKELENASAKFHISRLEALKLECRQQIEQLTGGMTDDVDAVLQDTYREGYYRSLYEVQKGVAVGFEVAALDKNLVKRIVNKPWHIDGSDFSSSIWSNKAKLLGVIDKEISKMVLTGSSPEKTIRAIQNQMHTSKSNAQRLVLTESAFFTTRAQADSYGELGVELYEVVGTLDKRTCDFCGSFDGKKFPVAEMEVGVNAPPFHPRCRCTTYPYDEDSDVFGVGTRAARDENGKTVSVPGDITFEEWKKKFVDGDKAGLKEIKSDDTMELKNKISDADTKITDLKKQFSDITDGYSYDEWFKDFKSIEEGYGDVTEEDEPNVIKLKDISQKLKDLIQKKAQWKSKLPVLGGQGTPLSITDALKGTNPKFASGTQYAVNCQRCVQAYELRRRGYDVEALPKPKKNNTIVWGNECFVDSSGNTPSFTFNQSENDIRSVLEKASDGSRYIIYTSWKNSRSAHVFIAEKENGIIRYVDPQTNKDNVEDYFSRGKKGKFGIIRVDDKDITTDYSKIKATVRW